MERPARATGVRRGLRAVHTLLRLVLVCALAVLLALIALRELQGLLAAAGPGRASISTATSASTRGSTTAANSTSRSVPTALPAGAFATPTGGGA